MEATQKPRQSGIELLRICAALGVITLHYQGLAGTWGGYGGVVMTLLRSICICAVDVFMLVSGYFLSVSKKRSGAKIFSLLFQVIVFRLAFFAVSVAAHPDKFSWKELLNAALPSNYFVILYLAVYILSPYLTLLLDYLSPAQAKKFLLTLIAVFSVWATGADLLRVLVGVGSELSPVGKYGAQNGYNFSTFFLLYCIGAYLRRYPLRVRALVLRLVTAACVLGLTLYALLEQRGAGLGAIGFPDKDTAWFYHNPLVVALAALFFLQFARLSFSSRVVNRLAKASFTCFLLHGKLLYYTGANRILHAPFPLALGHLLLVLIGCYLLSFAVDWVYHLATDWLTERIGKALDRRLNFSVS